MEERIHDLEGPLLILAGPGTGKTYQLAQRIKYLINAKEVEPDKITVITFTSAAAGSMREKISDETNKDQYIELGKQPRLICTMHHLGYRIVKEKYPDKYNRVVHQDALRNIIVRDAAQLAGYRREDGELASKCRQFGDCNTDSNSIKCKICNKYREILASCNAIDFDDQIFLACKILKEDRDLLVKYRSYCQHLLVDEYQDINASQFELINILSEGQRDGLFVVGDDDQSIYSWRGGSPNFIRNFRNDYGNDAKIRSLTKCYRCHRHILEGAISIVRQNDRQRSKEKEDVFEYKTEDGDKIKIHDVPSDEKEALFIARMIEEASHQKNILVLLPNRGFSKALIKELRKREIHFTAPLTLPGEGLPIVSTLSRWLSDISDNLSFRSLIEAFIGNPVSGVPSKLVRKPEKVEERESVFLYISRLWEDIIIGRCQSLFKVLESKNNTNDIYSALFSIFSQVLSMSSSREELSDFITLVVRNFLPWRKPQDVLDEVNSWTDLSSQLGTGRLRSGVQLMTFQSAKGLEADIVFIIGLEEDIIPRKDSSEDEVSEQSRLLYVSMTRAKEELHLFHARKRSSNIMMKNVYGKGDKPDVKPSRLIESIPTDHKEKQYHR